MQGSALTQWLNCRWTQWNVVPAPLIPGCSVPSVHCQPNYASTSMDGNKISQHSSSTYDFFSLLLLDLRFSGFPHILQPVQCLYCQKRAGESMTMTKAIATGF